jgi:hypothetical protein
MDLTLVPSDHTAQQFYNSSFHNNNFDNILSLNETQKENETDDSSEVRESQSIDITSININMHDSRSRNLQSTSKANISTTLAKPNNLVDMDTSKRQYFNNQCQIE